LPVFPGLLGQLSARRASFLSSQGRNRSISSQRRLLRRRRIVWANSSISGRDRVYLHAPGIDSVMGFYLSRLRDWTVLLHECFSRVLTNETLFSSEVRILAKWQALTLHTTHMFSNVWLLLFGCTNGGQSGIYGWILIDFYGMRVDSFLWERHSTAKAYNFSSLSFLKPPLLMLCFVWRIWTWICVLLLDFWWNLSMHWSGFFWILVGCMLAWQIRCASKKPAVLLSHFFTHVPLLPTLTFGRGWTAAFSF